MYVWSMAEAVTGEQMSMAPGGSYVALGHSQF